MKRRASFIILFVSAITVGFGLFLRMDNIKDMFVSLSGDKEEILPLSEVLAQGVVVQNNKESPNLGAFLHIKRSDTNEDVFVLYKPFVPGVERVCLNQTDASRIGVGTQVSVRGIIVTEIRGMKPRSLILSTCESLEYYITVLNEEKPKETILEPVHNLIAS
jgi:hypothetical protein